MNHDLKLLIPTSLGHSERSLPSLDSCRAQPPGPNQGLTHLDDVQGQVGPIQAVVLIVKVQGHRGPQPGERQLLGGS